MNLSRLSVLVAACAMASTASAQSLFLLNAFAVDQAGNTLVDLGGARILDDRGEVRACGQSTVMQATARLDAPGFLVRLMHGATPPELSVEQWSGHGIPEWRVETPFFSGVVAVPGGGAVVSRQAVGEDVIELQRLDTFGNELWRSKLTRAELAPAYYDYNVDDRGRTLFTLPRSLDGQRWQVDLGMLDAQGKLTWRQSEIREGFSIPALVNDGQGDFWWYQAGSGTPTASSPSIVQRLSPWGLPMFASTGPGLAAGREIERPVAGANDTLWYLATKPDVEIELARLTAGGKLARFPTGRDLITQLVADGEGAWFSAYTGLYEFTIEHYTADGRQWSRVLRGVRDVRLKVQPDGDLRLIGLESNGVSVRRIAAATGQVLWRTGKAQIERDCAALNAGKG